MTQTEIDFSPENRPERATDLDLAALDATAREHVESGRRANTTAAYASDRRKWAAYCREAGLDEHALTVGTLTAYVDYLAAAGAAPATIERRVSGARRSLRADGAADLSEDDRAVVAERVRQHKRHLAETGQRRGRGKARPLSVADLRAMSQALPDSLLGLRDRALLLIGFGMAARRSELAGLWTADVEVCDDGLCLTLRTSKTSDEDVELAIPWGTSSWTCPVRAWIAYRSALEEATGQLLTGKAFRRVDRHARVLEGMTGQAVGLVIKRAAERTGLDTDRVSAHGLRSGMATAARRAGHDAKGIAEQGRWSPNGAALYGYMHLADRWEDNPLKGIGL